MNMTKTERKDALWKSFFNSFHLISSTEYKIKVAEHIFLQKKGLFSNYPKNIKVVNPSLRFLINKDYENWATIDK